MIYLGSEQRDTVWINWLGKIVRVCVKCFEVPHWPGEIFYHQCGDDLKELKTIIGMGIIYLPVDGLFGFYHFQLNESSENDNSPSTFWFFSRLGQGL